MKSQKSQLILAIILGIVLSVAVGFLSSKVTQPEIATWYAGLTKPFFSPPNWLFAPVWTLLYVLMGWASGRVWHFGRRHLWGKTALYHFGAQLIFNGLWSLVFFGLKNPLVGLLVIIVLLILIERTIRWFRLVDKLSSYMLYPYLVWVSFATLLNGAILYLN
tara:strand:+ start:581 stop:1066 length:486 start_codon:yes stop_codon:yes gene_type:complete